MLAAAGLLFLLDLGIISATPDLARGLFALALTLVVGGFILAVWRSNSRMEKAQGSGTDGVPTPK